MSPNHRSRVSAVVVSLAMSLWLTAGAEAVDGVVLIDQNRALAGNVTPGDLPGFPVTISRSGSYRLAGNLDIADPNTTAIEIVSDDVTLDLNGFRIQGPSDVCSFTLVPVWCSVQTEGVGVLAGKAGSLDPLQKNIVVLNGIVRAMGSDGLRLGEHARVERLQVRDNRGDGINSGPLAHIANNTVSRNRAVGIVVKTGSLVVGNIADQNGGFGIIGDPSNTWGYVNNIMVGNNGGGGLQGGGGIQFGVNMCNFSICP